MSAYAYFREYRWSAYCPECGWHYQRLDQSFAPYGFKVDAEERAAAHVCGEV